MNYKQIVANVEVSHTYFRVYRIYLDKPEFVNIIDCFINVIFLVNAQVYQSLIVHTGIELCRNFKNLGIFLLTDKELGGGISC